MRTEQEILNDFKKLGCKIDKVKKGLFISISVKDKYWLDIEIEKELGFIYVYSSGIDFDFLPLLNELVECLKENKK